MNIFKNKIFWIVSGAVLFVAILGIVLFAVLSGVEDTTDKTDKQTYNFKKYGKSS